MTMHVINAARREPREARASVPRIGRGESTMADSSIVTLRLPKSLLSRADALVPRLRENDELFVVGRLSRSVVLRLAVLRGLESLEAQQPKAAVAKSTSKKRKR
jgi:hypothetical protein